MPLQDSKNLQSILSIVKGFHSHPLECYRQNQRWSPRGRPWPRGRPRGHILKSLALALASKPQVLGLGLEALGPRKLPCPRLEDSTTFEQLKFC